MSAQDLDCHFGRADHGKRKRSGDGDLPARKRLWIWTEVLESLVSPVVKSLQYTYWSRCTLAVHDHRPCVFLMIKELYGRPWRIDNAIAFLRCATKLSERCLIGSVTAPLPRKRVIARSWRWSWSAAMLGSYGGQRLILATPRTQPKASFQ